LKKFCIKDKECVKFIDLILTTAKHASELSSKLLVFSRKTQKRFVLTDMSKTIREALDIMERSIDRKISIKSEFNAKHTKIKGDPAQLQNTILNICLNARDAMPEGGEIRVKTEDSYFTSERVLKF
jgi:signal transduction histidine kinase